MYAEKLTCACFTELQLIKKMSQKLEEYYAPALGKGIVEKYIQGLLEEL